MCGFGLEIMAECHREAWCWKDEFQRSYTLRILHQIPAQFHGHDVPTETQLKEHMAAPSFKTLASARPCTIQHGCTVICYTENVNRAANCFIDHKLPISKCLFSIKNKKRGTRPPKKLDTRLDGDKKVLLEQFLDERLSTCNTDVDELRAVLQNAAAHVFGKKKRVQNDWFDDQDDTIQKLLQDKNMDRHVLRRRIRELKNNWFRHRAEEAERYSQEKNHRDFYGTLNAVYGPRSRTSHPVKSRNGELLTAPDMIKDR